MRPAVVSGIVSGRVPVSYWLIFSLVSCNSPRGLGENELVPVTLSFLKWRILKEITELKHQRMSCFFWLKSPSPTAPSSLPLVIEVS